MKKVFLVSVSILFKNGSRTLVLLHVFASAKKAKFYADYKQLQIYTKGANVIFGSPGSLEIESACINVSSESICTIDWSDDLKALQDETL